MKLALLGITTEALAFAREAISAGHSLRDVFDPAAESLELTTHLPNVQLRADWENLLHEREFDAVLVAGPLLADSLDGETRQRRDDQLRKLVQAGVPLITLPPVCEAILGFELEMIRRDTKGVIASYYPQAEHTIWNELTSREAPYEQITVERTLTSRSRGEVQAAFVNDLEVLRRFLGPLRRISASGGAVREKSLPDLTHVTVSVIGTNDCLVRWSVVPARDMPAARFTFYAAGATTSTIIILAQGSWSIIREQEEALPSIEGTEAFLMQLQLALHGEKNKATPWLDSCRNVEAMEAIDRSLIRSRTIELYNEELSEESSFKGTMAVWGCLLLMITLFLFVVMGMLPLLLGPKQVGGSSWWILQTCLIVPFVLFLLLQLLSFGLQSHQRRKHEQTGNAAKDAKPPQK